MKRVFLIFSLFFGLTISAVAITEIVKIGLYHSSAPESIGFSAIKGSYELHADGKYLLDVTVSSPLKISNRKGRIYIDNKGLGPFKKVHIKRKKWGCIFKIRPIAPRNVGKIHNDDLEIRAIGRRLRLVNKVYLEHYVGGVVESEAGTKQIYEYYKVQSVICRTYALSNLARHLHEGFNLCDQVHCQVYKNKVLYNRDIAKAARETRGIVIVDSEINLITAGFHSNCGGQTVNSEDVWQSEVPYLKSVCDTFCTSQPHANWQVEIPKNKWTTYFGKYHHISSQDTIKFAALTAFDQANRKRYLIDADSLIDLKILRKDWQLRSTFFNVEENDDSIHIYGNGYGHGVGLCQEGAMKMADFGTKYSDILHYYYKDVHLVYLSALDFFRD